MIKQTSYGPVTRFDVARTLSGHYWTTCYLVDGTLIDTGCAHAAPDLLRALAGMPVQRIVNTHTHEDHIGANGLLQRQRPGLEILAHPLSLPILADPHRTQPLHPYRRVMWGWPEPSQAHALDDCAWVETEHYRFQVLYTPGHAADHLCLYEPEQGWLFSGDLFVGGQDRAIRQGCEVWQIIASLKALAALPMRVLFPGSARVRENPASDLADKIAYYEWRGEQVLELHHQGWSAGRIARHLFGGPMLIEVITLGHFTRRELVRSYLHLLTNRSLSI